MKLKFLQPFLTGENEREDECYINACFLQNTLEFDISNNNSISSNKKLKWTLSKLMIQKKTFSETAVQLKHFSIRQPQLPNLNDTVFLK